MHYNLSSLILIIVCLNKDNKKYSRLCKSFSFLSRQVVYKDTQSSSSPKRTVFISEPNQLSIIPLLLKTQQSNYLKNLNTFRIKSGYLSSSSLYEKTGSASNLVKIKKANANSTNESSRVVSDAAVQTSIVSEGNYFFVV